MGGKMRTRHKKGRERRAGAAIKSEKQVFVREQKAGGEKKGATVT